MIAAHTWTRWTAVLLVISALLFAAAVFAEGTRREAVEVAHSEATEPAEPNDEVAEAEGHGEAGEAEVANDEAAEESLFGIDLENPAIMWGFVILSLAVAAVVFANVRPALSVAAALGIVAALLDGREVLTQLAEKNAGVAALAGATAIAHVAVAVVAVLAWRAGTAPIRTPRT